MTKLSSVGREIYVFCVLCTNSRRWVTADLIARVGRDATLGYVEPRLRCDNCGTHRAELRVLPPQTDEKLLRRYRKGYSARPRQPARVVPYSTFRGSGDQRESEKAAPAAPEYYPGSGHALSLQQAVKQLAYCYECNECGFRERVDLRKAIERFTSSTQVGDLKDRWPCGQCDASGKIVTLLWLNSSTTSRMLEQGGFPVWEDDDAYLNDQVSLTTSEAGLSIRKPTKPA